MEDKREEEQKYSTKIKNKISNTFAIITFLLIFVSSFTFNVQAATFNVQSTDSSVLDEARSIIKNNYVSTVPDSVLSAPTIEEMVKGLNDPYSQYFSKDEEQNFVNSIDNKMCGIGIYLEIVPEGVKVKSVISKSPAESSGIKEGDIIISADGKSLAGLTSDKASSYIKGEEGTIVNLIVKRENSNLTFNITRQEINVPTVEGKMLNPRTAYISIASFGTDTADLFTQKLKELRMNNPEEYIVDLRNNGGGYMATAIDIAGNFIGPNPAITIEDRQGKKVRYLADDKGSTIDKPIFFLINQYSASASEILAAAVKDYKKAFFIGTTTYGKGVAQQMFTLSDGTSLKITTEKFYSPNGNVIQKTGISPDFKVEDLDSLAVADLFSGKCTNSIDKTGYVKVTVGGKDFEIDLNTAKDENHWEAFKYILNNVSKDSVYIGTNKGWVLAPSDYFDNMYKFLYSNYRVQDTLKNVPKNKTFNVSFNKNVDVDKIKDNVNIEIIDSQTGERAAFDVKKLDDKKISLMPKEELKSGETYYIKIKDIIKPFTVK